MDEEIVIIMRKTNNSLHLTLTVKVTGSGWLVTVPGMV